MLPRRHLRETDCAERLVKQEVVAMQQCGVSSEPWTVPPGPELCGASGVRTSRTLLSAALGDTASRLTTP